MMSERAPGSIPSDLIRQRLSLPTGQLRVVVDTDAKNEIDDQYALTWALLSEDQLEIEGMYAAPYSRAYHREPLLKAYEQVKRNQIGQVIDGADVSSGGGTYHDWARRLIDLGRDPAEIEFVTPGEGTELSYHEILRIYDLLELESAGRVFRGSEGFLSALDAPLPSEAVDHLIERSLAEDERPLYVIALGALTNVASAILIEPKIIDRIIVVWTAGYPSFSPLSNRPAMNLVQDLVASQFLFDCGVPLVYLPGYYIGAQLSLSLLEADELVKGRGKIGDYLHYLYLNNPLDRMRGFTDHVGRTWIAWDLICVAWLLNPDWVPTMLTNSPILDDDMYWRHDDTRHLMREATSVNRDAIFGDFFRKLERAPG